MAGNQRTKKRKIVQRGMSGAAQDLNAVRSASWPVAYRWLATGTLMVYTAVGMSKVSLAQAPASPAAGQSRGPAQELPLLRFQIPPGGLGGVLDAFASATGLQIVIRNASLRTIESGGVSGWYTPEQALKVLLAGTGAAYSFSSRGTVTIDLEQVRTTVVVSAEASPLGVSLPKYMGPLESAPQTINVVSRQVIDSQGVNTLRDALRNVAGISLAAGEGGAQGDNLTIRGFNARNDLFIDGMRDFGSYYRDPFNTEEVEVLQGPSSMTFGRGSTGGVVNQSSKYPHLSRIVTADADLGSDLTRRVAADLDESLPALGTGAAFRLNVMGHEANVAGREVAENRRFGIAPSLALGLGTATRMTFGYFHQTADDIPDYGIPWLFNGPAPVDRHNYYGFKDGNFLRTYADIGTARVERDLNPRMTLRNQFRDSRYLRRVQITEPKVPATVTPATPLADIDITRNQLANNSRETYLYDQLDLTARFRTGKVEHALAAGVEGGRETSDPTRLTWDNVPTTSLLNPDPDQPFSGTGTVNSRVDTTAISAGAYVLDTLKLGKRWELSGGLRWDRFDADYRQWIAPASAFHRLDNMVSWRTAAVYKPVPAVSLYASASTSFNPSAESLSLSAGTANLPPEENRNYEVGSTWNLNQGRLSLRTAMFRTDKLNAREPDPQNSLLNVLAGTQRVNGAEFEARGRLLSRWEVLASYAYLDAHVIRSAFYPASVGARLANVPANTFNIWNDIRLPGDWRAGLGGNYVSSRTASSTAPLDPATGLLKELPGYWVFNAMGSHRLSEHADLQVNVYNLANRYYYDQLHPGHIVLGPGRSALVGLKFKF
jgi:catecholate siderophore receptor